MAPQKTVLITGCSDDGIGSAMALRFHEEGYHVFATARSPAKMSRLSGLTGVTLLPLDVCDQIQIQAVVESVSRQTNGTLDYLVNNAGCSHFMPLLDEKLDTAKRVYDTNAWGPLSVTQALAPLLIQSRGAVAFVTSISGHVNVPYMGVYAASKRSLEIMAEALRLELAPFHVRVVSFVTGAVRTPARTYLPVFRLPEGSLYASIEETIERRSRGKDGNPREDVARYAATVVTNLTRGAVGKIWCGANAGSTKFATSFLPTSLMDKGVVQGTGLEAVNAPKAARK